MRPEQPSNDGRDPRKRHGGDERAPLGKDAKVERQAIPDPSTQYREQILQMISEGAPIHSGDGK